MQEVNRQGEIIRRIFNPGFGKYEVAADIGPNVLTRRKEAVEALTLMLTEAPALTAIVGDILLRNMEFDDAQEAAMRLRRLVPPAALGEGPSQNEQQLQQQVQQLQSTLAQAMQKVGKAELKLVGKDEMRDIDSYEAETNRIKALAPFLQQDPQGIQQLVQQLVEQAMETSLSPVLQANIEGLQAQMGAEAEAEEPPVPGAQKAPDGDYYLLDPTRRTRYLRVMPLAQERAPPGARTAGS
jgi:hypothetical protein